MNMQKYRSLDNEWDGDDILFAPGFSQEGYLKHNGKRYFVESDESFQYKWLNDSHLLNLGLGDGIYEFVYLNNEEFPDTYHCYWLIKNNLVVEYGILDYGPRSAYNLCFFYVSYFNLGKSVSIRLREWDVDKVKMENPRRLELAENGGVKNLSVTDESYWENYNLLNDSMKRFTGKDLDDFS